MSTTQAAEALQAAHDSGIIHRDIKPGNILVSGDASGDKPLLVKLTDFGIGQVVSVEVLAGVTRSGFTQTMLSSTSSPTGTHIYMAPELLAGKPASTRSDIYSLGAVLYQLLVDDLGQPVTVDWADSVPDNLLREDLKHCLAGKAEERFTSVGQLSKNLRCLPQRQAALAEQRAAEDERERLLRRAARRRVIALASAGVAVAMLLLALVLGYGLKRARAAELLSRRHLYASDMLLAAQAFHANNRGRAIQLLERNRPRDSVDLRGWEWRYLSSLCRSKALPLSPAHAYVVTDVTFSPDGRLLYSASYDATFKVWDVATRSLLSTHTHPGRILTMALAPDGQWLVTGGTSKRVLLWNTRTWTSELLVTNRGQIIDLRFSPSGDRLTIRNRGEIEVLQWSNRIPVTTLPAGSGHFQGRCPGFSPDGQLAAYRAGNNVTLSDLQAGSVIRALPGDMDRINSIVFSPDGRFVAASDWSPRIAVWDVASNIEVASLTNHTAWVSSVAFLPDGSQLISAGADQTVKHWDTIEWKEIETRRGHLDEVWCLAISPQGDRLATGSKDGTVCLWNTRLEPQAPTRLELGKRQRYMSLDGRTLLVSEADGTLVQYDAPRLEVVRTVTSFPYAAPEANAVIGFGTERLAVGKADGDLEIWNTVTWDQVARWTALTSKIARLTFSRGDRLLAVASSANMVSILEVESGRQIARFPLSELSTSPLTFSPDEQLLAAGFGSGIVRVWRLNSALPPRIFEGQHDIVDDLAFSPDSRSLVTPSYDSSLWLWEVETGRNRRLPRALMAYSCVAYSPDGQRIAAGGDDDVVRIIDTKTGEELALLSREGDRDWMVTLRFCSEGNVLLAMGKTALRVWRAAPAAELEVTQNPGLTPRGR